jgi:tetratricopeptide (TPR) repeat protein
MDDKDDKKKIIGLAVGVNYGTINQTILLPNKPITSESSIPSAKGFVGRENYLQELDAWYAGGERVFVLHGLGGVGKTALAQKFAEKIKSEYDSHIYLDLQGVNENPLTPADTIMQVLRIFDPNIPDGIAFEKLHRQYVSLLNQRRILLFLDNAKDEAQIEPLNKSNNSCLLVTSRQAVSLAGARIQRIDQMSTGDARALLFSIADEERFNGYAGELAHLAGYLPMALLPLAALLARNYMESAADLVQKYQARQERLSLANPAYRDNITVFASFDLSYEVLSDEFQKYWRQLAVFPADFHNGGPGYVWGIESEEAIDDILKRLCRYNLLNGDRETERYRLHDLARDYLNEKIRGPSLFTVNDLIDAAKLATTLKAVTGIITTYLRSRFKASTIELLNHYSGPQPPDSIFLKALVDELNNLLLDPALYQVDRFKQVQLSAATQQLISQYSLDTDPRRLNRMLLSDAYPNGIAKSQIIEDGENELHDSSKRHAEFYLLVIKEAYSFIERNNYKDALYYFDLERTNVEAGKTWTKIFAGKDETTAQLHLDYTRYDPDLIILRLHPRKVMELQRAALSAACEQKDPQGEVIALKDLGITYRSVGDYRFSILFLENALRIAKKYENRRNVSEILSNLGVVYCDLGKFKRAFIYHERALRIARDFIDPSLESKLLGNLGSTYRRIKPFYAIEFYEHALQVAQDTKNQRDEGIYLGSLGKTYLDLSKFDRAINLLERALQIAREISDRESEGLFLGDLGIAYNNSGNRVKGLAFLRDSINILEAIESPDANSFQYAIEIERNRVQH